MSSNYNSISLKKLYITAAAFTIFYMVISVIAYLTSGPVFKALLSHSITDNHPDIGMSGKCKALLCALQIAWLPFLMYIFSCVGWAFSAKRCKRTLKAAPTLWLLGFIAEHTLALFISHTSMAESHISERWLIQRTEYVTFFFSILLVGALVLVCTAAALGIDEDRHVKHLKYK
jgi:hypothetical protein